MTFWCLVRALVVQKVGIIALSTVLIFIIQGVPKVRSSKFKKMFISLSSTCVQNLSNWRALF